MSQLTDAAKALRAQIDTTKADAAQAESLLKGDVVAIETQVKTFGQKAVAIAKQYAPVAGAALLMGHFGPSVLSLVKTVL